MQQTTFSDADFLGALRVKEPTATAEANILKYFNFSEKIRPEISFELSAIDNSQEISSFSFSVK